VVDHLPAAGGAAQPAIRLERLELDPPLFAGNLEVVHAHAEAGGAVGHRPAGELELKQGGLVHLGVNLGAGGVLLVAGSYLGLTGWAILSGLEEFQR
jgi:hypothetical protein